MTARRAAYQVVLRVFEDDAYADRVLRTAVARLDPRDRALAQRLPFGTVQRVGAMLTFFCQEEPVRDYEDASRSDTEAYGALFRHLLANGVYVAPSQFECLFLSLAHDDDEIDRTAEEIRGFLAA